MCGIFGIVSSETVNSDHIQILAKFARKRGKDSSGLFFHEKNKYTTVKADDDILKLIQRVSIKESNFIMGHSRLITNGLNDNQPVVSKNIAVIHNGIVVNDTDIWPKIDVHRKLEIDTEIIAAITEDYLSKNGSIDQLHEKIFELCKGVVSCAIAISDIGKLVLLSNNGSLYVGYIEKDLYFSSEKYPLDYIKCNNIFQLKHKSHIIDIPKSSDINIKNVLTKKRDLIPKFKHIQNEKKLLVYNDHNLKRCTRCILPETMPFITFNSKDGVCNYCSNYKIRNSPKPVEEIFKLVEKYRRKNQPDCLVPFSGGRDSCYGLHLIVHELKMNPITYTYDWGMVTDLGRRNISRFCAELGVENIIVADDILKKRQNIRKNLEAWLKSPHLGMISILTAGDKHFFRHIETVKKQTGVSLNLWGVNPLEVTHFKAGFLGIKPDFEEKRVYINGAWKQVEYQKLRFKAMLKSLGYFNSSLWDTISGEYYRSFTEKKDYYHIFDYWRWDEDLINSTLQSYDWELAPDTTTTWRIGDGTAAFYNYIYYTVAGFTEHDTFRSNQIREGQVTREDALKLVKEENQPRYENIRWYLDTLNMDFEKVIKIINNIHRMY
jgi:glucosamine--fructose-6-phosphate aminotransferase (isomerizing)